MDSVSGEGGDWQGGTWNGYPETGYDALAPAYAMERDMIAMRMARGLTQADMAKLLGTQKSNISRLETVNSDVSPRIETVEAYARALGYRMKIAFEPERAKR